jgi:hypothetical protein
MNASKRGMSLMTVLLGMTVLLLLLFTMAEASIFHLQFATSLDSRQEAKNLAESAVNEALAEFLGNDQYGKTAIPPVVVPGEGDPTRNYGVVSFLGADSRVPNSLNNLGSLNQVQGSTGHGVPGNTIHIVGRGRVGDSTSTVEAIYYRPPFPKALSASGRIHAVGTIVEGATPGSSTIPVPASEQIPGCIQTNALDSGNLKAVDLVQCAISGDAAAVGSVQLDTATTISGEVRQNGSPQAIAQIDVQARINDIKDASSTEILSGTIGDKTLNWFAGCRDAQLVINGNLNLQNGVLWTLGDLKITGAVSGEGLILCGGKVEVLNGSDLSAQSLVAVAAVGDVIMKGQGQSNYGFKGIVYTNGNFISQDLTVKGSVIANSSDPNKGGIDLNNVYVVQTPESVSLSQGGMMQVWQTQSTGLQGQPGERALPSAVTVPPAPITYLPGTRPDPSATRSQIFITLSPTADTILNALPPDQAKANFTVYNAAKPIGPLNPSTKQNVFMKNNGRDPREASGSTVETHVRWLLKNAQRYPNGDNWYAPLRKSNSLCDGIQQTDQQIANPTRGQLFPPVNSLLATGERSRVLLWRSY